MAFNISYVYKAVDAFTPTAKKIQGALAQVKRQTDSLKKSQDALGRRTDALKTKAGELRGAMIDIGVAAYVFSRPIKAAIAFESAMADVKKVVDFKTPVQFAQMAYDIQELSKSIPLTQEGLAQIVAAGGRLGIPRAKLLEFAKTAAMAAVAFDMTAQTAGDALASISAKMGVPIDKIGGVADAINHLSDTTAAKAPNMINIMGRVAGQFKTMKFPSHVAAGFAAFADQVMVSPELAASGLNMFLARLSKFPKLYDKFLKDPQKATVELANKFKKLKGAARAQSIEKMFGAEAGKFVLQLVENTALLEKTMGKVADKTKFAGSMSKEFAIRSKTTANALTLAGNRVRNMAINIGTALLPAINSALGVFGPLVDIVASLAERFPWLTQALFGTVIALTAVRIATLALAFANTQLSLAALTALSTLLKIPGGAKLVAVAQFMLAKATAVASGAWKILNLVFAASPIGVIVLGITTLVGLGIMLYKNFKPFRELIDYIWETLKNIGSAALEMVGIDIGVTDKTAKVAEPAAVKEVAGVGAAAKTTDTTELASVKEVTGAGGKLNGEIVIRDRAGAVESASSKSSGPGVGDLGLNMGPA